MKEYKVIEYEYSDMTDLELMSWKQVKNAIDRLDRGYWNRYVHVTSDKDTYSEDEYDDYEIQVALRKVDALLREKIKEAE